MNYNCTLHAVRDIARSIQYKRPAGAESDDQLQLMDDAVLREAAIMNNYPWLDDYLLGKPGATKDFKVEWGWYRYMAGGKMFAAVMHTRVLPH
jgi:hypothetical protein